MSVEPAHLTLLVRQDEPDPVRAQPAALPVRLVLQPGEALDAYLERVADANHLRPRDLEAAVTSDGGSARHLTLIPEPVTLQRISCLTGIGLADLRAAALAGLPGLAPTLTYCDTEGTAGSGGGRHAFRQVATRLWSRSRGTTICPRCLFEAGLWKIGWRSPLVTTCAEHGLHLLEDCPGCGRPFRDQHHGVLRPDGATTCCGNPTAVAATAGRSRCLIDLTLLRQHAATPADLTRQRRTDAALHGETVLVIGRPTSGPDYLMDLWATTVLLLHLAHPTYLDDALAPPIGGSSLSLATPDWSDQLVDARNTTGPRRWSLHAPRPLGLRAAALNAADLVLAQPSLEDGCELWRHWVSRTPPRPEGQLGWLADHTHMTKNLTRLTMATLAPHRRIAHLLTTVEHPAPANAELDVRRIPQVLPPELYESYLGSRLGCGADTGRLFASLCLARIASHADTWEQAAQILGVPAELGARTARAASARTTTGASDVATAMTRIPLPDLDYRDLENRVRRLANTQRWFRRWARTRPGTHAASRDYAITWLWTHVANGHLTTTPTRRISPLRSWRAGYRQFARSLTEEHAAQLIATLP